VCVAGIRNANQRVPGQDHKCFDDVRTSRLDSTILCPRTADPSPLRFSSNYFTRGADRAVSSPCEACRMFAISKLVLSSCSRLAIAGRKPSAVRYTPRGCCCFRHEHTHRPAIADKFENREWSQPRQRGGSRRQYLRGTSGSC